MCSSRDVLITQFGHCVKLTSQSGSAAGLCKHHFKLKLPAFLFCSYFMFSDKSYHCLSLYTVKQNKYF